MSLELAMDTVPDGLRLDMHSTPFDKYRMGSRGGLNIGDYHVGNKDMAELVWYWLTNTDLVYDDSRVKLVEMVKQTSIVQGYNGENSKRIGGNR